MSIKKIPMTPAGIEPATFPFVAQHPHKGHKNFMQHRTHISQTPGICGYLRHLSGDAKDEVVLNKLKKS